MTQAIIRQNATQSMAINCISPTPTGNYGYATYHVITVNS